MTPPPQANTRFARWRQLASRAGSPILMLLLLQLMGGMMLSPHRTFFPLYLHDLGYSALLISSFSAARQAMGLVASLLGGTAADALGRKRTILLGQIGFLLSSLVFLTRAPAAAGVLWALGGLGMGLTTLGSQSYLIDHAPADYLGLFTAFYNWGYTLGGTLSSPIAGFLLDRWDYGMFGTALVLFSIVTLVLSLFALPDSTTDKPSPVADKRLFGYRDLVARPPVIVLVLLRFLPTVYWGMAILLIPLLLNSAGANNTTIAVYTTISQICAAVAQVIVGRATDRVGAKWPSVITFALLTASILGIGWMPDRLWGVFTFGTLSTAAAWSLSTLLPSWVARIAPSHERGRLLGWVHMWWNLAMMVGSTAGGYLYERAHGLPFLASGALSLGAIALTFVFFRMGQNNVKETVAA